MKKLLALLLAAVMLFGLVACGGKPEDSGEPTDVTASVEGEYHGELPFVKEGDEPVTITIGIISNANVQDYKDNALTRWLEEKTGLNLEFKQYMDNATAAQQVTLATASGEKLPDILWRVGSITKQQGEAYGRDGYFAPMSEYFEKYAYYMRQSYDLCYGGDPKPLELVLHRAAGADDQPIYCFPHVLIDSLDEAMIQPWINQDWLDALGMKAPSTIDELYDVLVAFRDKDPNGNGVADEIPMIGKVYGTYNVTDPLGYLINAFTFYNDQTYFTVDNGVIGAPYKSDEYREALKFVNKLVKEKLLSELCWTMSNEELKGLANPMEGEDYKAGIIFTSSFTPENDSMRAYVPLKPLADYTGKGGYAPMTYSRVMTTYISADCEHPDLAFKLLDFMCSQEAYLRQTYGEEGVDWEYSNKEHPGEESDVTGHRGGKARIKVLNPNLGGEMQSQVWCSVGSVASDIYWQYEVDLSDPNEWNTQYVNKYNEIYQNTLDAPHPAEEFDFAIYSLSDYEERADFWSDLRGYMYNQRADFCVGTLDPNNDADWQTYLEGLDTYNYDRWIEIGQMGYSRLFE